MNKMRFTLKAVAFFAFTLACASAANAQATRTWVSGVGDDVNPCSRTAPCKTFAGAISKTADKGEIDCLDPGGFGTITITKNITIDGAGTLGSILAAGTNGVNVNDSATATPNTIVVHLRNLSINGANTGVEGIRFVAGKRLVVESCVIFKFRNSATSDGIDFSPTAAGQTFLLDVKDTVIKDNAGSGIRLFTTSSTINASIDNCSLTANNNGLEVPGGTANISRSVIDSNAAAGMTVSAGAFINADENRITSNGTGVTNTGATLRMSGNKIYRNGTGVAGTGTYQSFGDNRVVGNTTDVAAGTTISNISATNSK